MSDNNEVTLTRGTYESDSFSSRSEQDAYDRGHAVGFRDHTLQHQKELDVLKNCYNCGNAEIECDHVYCDYTYSKDPCRNLSKWKSKENKS